MEREKEKLIEFIDDTVDIGKEPLPITDPELERLCNQIMDKYK